jgi:hypothetical protein
MAQQIIDSRSFNVRRKATGNMTFYLRTGGNNANDGTTEAKAMLTFNALMLRLYREWDFQNYEVTIDVGEGTWAGEAWFCSASLLVAHGLTITGKGRDKTIIEGGTGWNTFEQRFGHAIIIKNLCFRGADQNLRALSGDIWISNVEIDSGKWGIVIGYGARVLTQDMLFFKGNFTESAFDIYIGSSIDLLDVDFSGLVSANPLFKIDAGRIWVGFATSASFTGQRALVFNGGHLLYPSGISLPVGTVDDYVDTHSWIN